MGFQIELFSALAQANRRAIAPRWNSWTLSNADRRDVVVKPADFPRIAREIKVR